LFYLLTASRGYLLSSPNAREGRPVALNLPDIVHLAVQQPLPVDLKFAPQRKAIQAFGRTQIGKDRLNGGKAALLHFCARP